MTPEEHERLLSHKNLSYGFGALLLLLITLVVAMRILTRVKLLRRLSLEDYLLLFSWLAYAAGYNTVVFKIAAHGVVVHQWNLTLRQFIDYLYFFHAGTILYNIVILPLKLSIIIQILRAFVPSGSRTPTFWMAHALIWTNILFYVTSTAITIFACKPTSKSYDPTVQGGRCLDAVAVNITSASLNSLSDALLLILPQQVIWRLSLPRKRKWVLSIAFLGGILSLVSAIVRLAYLIILDHSKDVSYYSGQVGVWSFPEIAFGFLVACLPVVRGFLNLLRDSQAASVIRSMYPRRRRPPSDSSTDTTARRRAQALAGIAQFRYQNARPHVSDIEYHELVVKSGSSWVAEGEAREENWRPWLVAKPPRTVIRPKSYPPRRISEPVVMVKEDDEIIPRYAHGPGPQTPRGSVDNSR
ncbi:unnamed protein product [Periconia digitata]|uniref:Rhodopsin domain-containing protein n=1 Tax=Periconia digitata TaxID=1303443 RepID=A0A9W4U302_9PLEO|nr:unnamed protein product [Periconia digitata]